MPNILKIIFNTTIPYENHSTLEDSFNVIYYTAFDAHKKLRHVRANCSLDQLFTQHTVFDWWSTVRAGTQVSTGQKNYWHWIKCASPTEQIIALLLYNVCQCNWNIWNKGCNTYIKVKVLHIKHIYSLLWINIMCTCFNFVRLYVVVFYVKDDF